MDAEHLVNILFAYDIIDYNIDNLSKTLKLTNIGNFELLAGMFGAKNFHLVMLPGEKRVYESFDYSGWRVHGLMPPNFDHDSWMDELIISYF
jgi:hypothetical protein